MSSRARKKLAKQNDILRDLATKSDEDDDEVITVASSKSKGKTLNAFDLLRAEEGKSESNSDAEKCDQIDEMESPDERNSEINIKAVKKKKNKKKKKKGSKTNKEKIEEEEKVTEDEIDKSIREVNLLLGVKANSNAGGESVPVELTCKSLLCVEHRYLNADNEMRRKFGSNVVGSERRKNNHRKVPVRSSWLVTPKPNWKPANKTGLSMKMLDNSDGIYQFTFEHLPSYQEVQFKFVAAVESLDHNNIVALLNNHPNHIDSLLQLSEVCKMSEDVQMAAELIERALYIFERSFHTLFNVTRGNCRLEYRRAENRSFFLALFRHLSYVGDRACCRTSLEFCKLILGLDPEDPLAILLLIDFFALKSDQNDYLIQIFNEWEVSKNLLKLPNFAFSVPLAMFHSHNYSKEKASQMLEDALIKFPTTLLLLMDKCSVKLDESIMSFAYFQRTNDIKQSDGLNRLISLYVGRNFSLWKIPEVLDWLAVCAHGAMRRINSKDPLVKQWEPLWRTLYQRMPLNIYRHIVISDIKEATRSLPPEISNQAMNTYDPLPPPDSISGYKIPERNNHGESDSSFLSLFLHSLLPSYGAPNGNNENRPRNPPQQLQRIHPERPAQGDEGATAADRPGMENHITESAQRLMGAMRELLSSMTYRGDLEELNDDENGFNDEDWQDHEDFFD